MLKLGHDINHCPVSNIGAVFFKGNAQHAHGGVGHVNAVLQHEANDVARGITAHVVVNGLAREDHLRAVTQLLGLVS